MHSSLFKLAVLHFGLLVSTAQLPGASLADPVSFTRDIAPVLQQKCLACHGPEKQKGGYRLDSFEWLLQAGDSEATPIVPGDAGSSSLFRLVIAADEDDRMPQQDDALPAEFVAKLESWLAGGAKFDGPNPKQSLADLVPPPNHPAPPEVYPHAIPVLSLAMIGDGQLAIGGYHEILIRELPSGKLRQRLTNLPERIHALLPVNEGRRLFYAGGYPGRAGETGLMDLTPSNFGAAPKVLARAADAALALAITADGKQVAVGGADKLIRLIDVASGQEVRQLSQHADWIMGLAYNADGTRLASASRDGTARVFDPATGEMICAFREHNGPVFDVVFVGEGSLAASAGRDGRIRFWTTDQGDQKGAVGELGGDVFKLAYAGGSLLAAVANGSIVEVSAGDRKVVRRWAVEAGDPVISLNAGADAGFWLAGLSGGQLALSPAADGGPVSKLEVWPRGRD